MVTDLLFRRARRERDWRGALVSLSLHALLVLAACWIVMREPAKQGRPAPSAYVGPGGGAAPAVPHRVERALKPPAKKLPKRIAAVGRPAGVRLPPPAPMASAQGSALESPLSGRTGGKGFGSGSPAGVGAGPGVGAARAFRSVMGLRMRATKVAVYLDCSGSMRPYLPRVEAEIRSQYPDADVFRFDGARIVGLDDRVVHGRGFTGDPPRLREEPTMTDPATLTPAGRSAFLSLRPACEKGSLGAWIDRMLHEPYDALVVFSDFQDGVRIYHRTPKGPRQVYSDSAYAPMKGEVRASYRWQSAWLEAFGRASSGRGPRLYLFSLQREPQDLLRRCVEASGGGSVAVGWLRRKAR